MGYKGREVKGLKETLVDVRENSEIIANNTNKYNEMLGQLLDSDFVKEMRNLQSSVIN